jgi:hypothetical protein
MLIGQSIRRTSRALSTIVRRALRLGGSVDQKLVRAPEIFSPALSAIDSKSSAVRVRGSLRASGTDAFVGIAIRAGYRQTFETTNQVTRDQVLRNHNSI